MKKLLYIFLFIPFTFLGQNNSYVEQDIPLSLHEGWSMFGFTCLEPINVINAFSLIEESVLIVKNNGGEVYLPEWNFNGIGVLEYSRGYQIKLTQEITDFQFCPAVVPLVDSDGDGVYDIVGCMDMSACNYNELATDVCEFPTDGYDCEGNILPQYQVGDYSEGGIVLYVGESGNNALVAAIDNLDGGDFANDDFDIPGMYGYEWGCFEQFVFVPNMMIGAGHHNTIDIINYGCSTIDGSETAAEAAYNFQDGVYNDWFLPSIDELSKMYSNYIEFFGVDSLGVFSAPENYYFEYLPSDTAVFFGSSSEEDHLNAWRMRILTDGSIETGRMVNECGAHTKGLNCNSKGCV